ncbi:NUDIX domain-containing protein [Blastomonas sp.]|uniref:NUDIX domain-containing protein n=1 Tax=Blastomonas sp. TaxID=1909299 RepID=UPI00260C8D1C|nr:NUDIX domain-containing protein [Blastomonas sp.]MDM7957212.1 NUDIX domain-containing protein [Blastomonas sp.]
MKPIHLAYIVAQRVRVWWRRTFQIRTRGVKAVVLRGDSVLLIRHSYQSPDTYMLPGGGIDRRERAMEAGAREVREETGCILTDMREHGQFVATSEGWPDHITVVVGQTTSAPVADGKELLEARFFPLNALPANLSPASLRGVKEVRDGLPPADAW